MSTNMETCYLCDKKMDNICPRCQRSICKIHGIIYTRGTLLGGLITKTYCPDCLKRENYKIIGELLLLISFIILNIVFVSYYIVLSDPRNSQPFSGLPHISVVIALPVLLCIGMIGLIIGVILLQKSKIVK